MRKLKTLLLLGALLAAGGMLRAQANEVALIENDGRFALFSVQASSAKESEVSVVAIRILFQTLLEQGVDGFMDGNPLEQKPNAKWKSNFLKEKNPPYMSYVKGFQTEGEPLRNKVGQYEATVLVRVNVEFLVRQLKNYGVMNK